MTIQYPVRIPAEIGTAGVIWGEESEVKIGERPKAALFVFSDPVKPADCPPVPLKYAIHAYGIYSFFQPDATIFQCEMSQNRDCDRNSVG